MVQCAGWVALVTGGKAGRPSSVGAMDNYEIQKTEPRGSYGFVHIVKRINDGRTFAMKVVEFMDEATANRAVEEAMIMLKLDHPNICHYEEIFVSWDHEVSAVTVCMVMDYSPVGDLASVIQTKRQMKGKIREMVIKNFLGQMVDVLIYLKSKHVIHRNLKPTNIQMLADLSFTICDFIFPTFVGDEVKFKIRMKDYSKVWMAPEALKRRLLAKSDIWSLGCILLEMMTCNMMDVVRIIRSNWKHLKFLLGKLHVEKKYTNSLCNLVQLMLEPDPAERISAMSLLDLQYVKESLVICGSTLSGIKKVPVGTELLPFREGIDKLLEFMLLQVDVEEIQKISLKYIIYLLYEAEVLAASERIIPVLISILNYHADCLEVQAQVSRILLMFAIKATEDSVEEGILFSENVISIILSIMASRHKCVELQQVLCNFLMLLSGSEAARILIGKAKGIQEIMTVLRIYMDNSHVCIPCCGALWSLVVTNENAQIARTENMLQTILQVLEKHIQNGDVVESASAALWVLSLQEPLNDEQLEDITLLLIEALDLHLRKEIIVKNICFALSSLIRLSELVAFRILVPEDHLDGLALIVQSYHIHFTDPEVVHDICMVFQEMVQYKDVVPELISQKLDVTLNAIKVKFASNEDIVTVLDSTLSKLQAAETGAQNEDSRNTKDSV